MISCGEKMETDTERDILEVIGALADRWELCSMDREDFFDWVAKGGRPKLLISLLISQFVCVIITIHLRCHALLGFVQLVVG
jgi:hypothetical protein